MHVHGVDMAWPRHLNDSMRLRRDWHVQGCCDHAHARISSAAAERC